MGLDMKIVRYSFEFGKPSATYTNPNNPVIECEVDPFERRIPREVAQTRLCHYTGNG